MWNLLKKHAPKIGKKASPLLLFILLISLALLYEGAMNFKELQTLKEQCPFSDLPQKDLFIKDKILRVEVVKTALDRRCGLSFRSFLPEDHGMLFVFEKRGVYGIWMKDMNFSIDILWIDEAHRVVDHVLGASPESYPGVFTPKEEALYVLEVSAGTAEKYDIAKGDEVVF